MLLDIAIALPIIILTMFGFRDGIVKKVVGIAVAIGAMFLGQFYMQDIGKQMIKYLNTTQSNAPLLGFFFIFVFLLLLESLLYRVLAHNYKIGGFADRIAGSALGFLQGALIMSVVLVMLSLKGVPSEKTRRESRAYYSVVNLVPRIFDFAATAAPQVEEKVKERLEQYTTPSEAKPDGQKEESEEVKYIRETEKTMKSSKSAVDSILHKRP